MVSGIVWTRSAIGTLASIYEFTALNNVLKAKAIIDKIYSSSAILKTFPQLGAKERFLEGRAVAYRSLIVDKRYKLIYHIENDVVYIVSVWDTRQSHKRLQQTVK